MLALCLYAAVTPTPVLILQQVARAHADMSAGSLTAKSELYGTGPTAASHLDVRYQWPTNFRMKSLAPSTGKMFRDWSIEPGRVVDYDPALEQYTTAERKAADTLGKTLAGLDQNLDDVVLAFTEPLGMRVWIEPMLGLRPWTVTSSASKNTLTYKLKDKKIAIVTDRATARLLSVDVVNGAQRIKWAFQYRPRVEGVAFVAPPGVYEVPVFDRQMAPPKFADNDARRAAYRMFDSYANLSSLGYRVVRDSGVTTVYLKGKFARQEDDAALWTYDGTTLVLFNKRTKRWYSGKLGFRDVVESVGDLGTRVDPTLRLLMTGFNPYRKRLGDGATIKKLGTLTVQEQPATILQSVSENAQITLIVRDSDGRVINSSTRARSHETEDEGSVDLKYEYVAVPQDVESRLRLTVPKGASATRLTPKPTT